jgi:hypothetical protein
LLITVMGPTSASLTPEAVRRDLLLVRGRLATPDAVSTSAFELATAIRVQILRSQEALVTAAAAARAAELEKSVMSIDPVQAEAVLGDLFALRHDL